MRQALKRTWQSYRQAIPMIIGVLLLVNLLNPVLQRFYPRIFTGNYILDPLLGALGGSIAFGIPITSYVAGGELLDAGVSLLAVTAFIMAWTTVGFAMLPLEIMYLGKKFSLVRNGLNFIFAIIIAMLTIFILNLL